MAKKSIIAALALVFGCQTSQDFSIKQHLDARNRVVSIEVIANNKDTVIADLRARGFKDDKFVYEMPVSTSFPQKPASNPYLVSHFIPCSDETTVDTLIIEAKPRTDEAYKAKAEIKITSDQFRAYQKDKKDAEAFHYRRMAEVAEKTKTSSGRY